MFRLSQTRTPLFLSLLFGLSMVLAACGETTVVDKTVRNAESPRMRSARVWADKELAAMDLPRKVGQLIMAQGPNSADSNVVKAYADVLDQFHIGGMVLPNLDRDALGIITEICQQGTKAPIWIGLDVDADWADANGFSHLLSLGATHVDSLARDWGRAVGAECFELGAHICFSSATKVSNYGIPFENSFGENPAQVERLSMEFLRGMLAQGALPCLRALPGTRDLPADAKRGFPVIDKAPRAMYAQEMGPTRSALGARRAVLQMTHAVFPQVDSLPADLSAKAAGSLVRYGLEYKGLLFSASFQDSAFGRMYPPGVAERMALEAGVDVIVAPRDPVAVIDEVLRAVESGLIEEAELDIRVHKVLLQKAYAGLDSLAIRPVDSTRLARNLIALKAADYRVAEHAITLLVDDKKRIPLRKNVEEAKVATLALGVRKRTPMQKMMSEYAKMDHTTLPSDVSVAKLEAQIKRLKKYDYVLVGLHAGLETEGDSLPARIRDFLDALEKQNKLVVAQFGRVHMLAGLDSLSCVLTAYDDRALSQEIVGQFIWGGVSADGHLPVNVSARFALGSGEDSRKKIRLEYVSPEVLGIDPSAIVKVDSIINTAIWLGTFPGCQVIAAKDGKVFLHKAYGHHDYERSRKVRLTDVYDIASVTKIAATTLMAMRAYEQDTLHLNYPIKYYLDELDSNFITIRNITPKKLLIHQAGLPPGLPVYKYYTMIDSVDSLRSRYYSHQPDDSLFTVKIADRLYFNQMYHDSIWHKIRVMKLDTAQGYKYSDVSMFLLKEVLERMYDQSLDKYVSQNFYRPLGLQTLGYYPLDRFEVEEIAPTEKDSWWRKQQLRGHVHDHSTALFGGVGGQAGLFSNVRDLAIIMQMLLNEGEYGGKRYFKKSTVRKFTSRQAGSHRGLGFDMQRPTPVAGKGYNCMNASPNTFGHFGFTGTCAWADPDNQIVYVLLTNRVYPKARNWKINSFRVRQAVQQVVYDALGLGAVYCEPMLFAQNMDSLMADSLAIVGGDDGLRVD